jgi:hypothetical protein
VAGALMAVGVLLAPSVSAFAEDNNPSPPAWPTVAPPDSSGEAAEPAPVKWPAAEEPDKTGDGNSEPQPAAWPTVKEPQ